MWNGWRGQPLGSYPPADERKADDGLRSLWSGTLSRTACGRREAAARQFALFALSGVRLDALMRRAVVVAAETLEVEYTAALELLPDGREFGLHWGIGWKEGVVGHGRVNASADSQAGYTLLSHVALLSREPVITPDLSTDVRFHSLPFLRDHGVTSGVSVVIQGPRRPFGVLAAHSTVPWRFTGRDGDFLQAIADVLSAAILRQEAERVALEGHAHLRLLVDRIPGVFWTTDADFRLTSVRGAALRTLELQPDGFVGRSVLDLFQSTPDSGTAHAHRRAAAGHSSSYQLTCGKRVFQAYVEAFRDRSGSVAGCIGLAFDVTERARAEEQAGQLLLELQDAQAKMKVLRGFLPICASCKQIRDDSGYWKQIESYICEHADVRFSHGLCPDCLHRLYPDLSPNPPQDALKGA